MSENYKPLILGNCFNFEQFVARHCVKSVLIRSYSGPHFPAFGLSEYLSIFTLRIQSRCGKMQTRITPNTDTFYPVRMSIVSSWLSETLFNSNATTTWLCRYTCSICFLTFYFKKNMYWEICSSAEEKSLIRPSNKL